MPGVKNGEWQQIMDKLSKYISKHAPQKHADLLNIFAERYYSSSSVDDLDTRSIKSLYAQLVEHWEFVYCRKPDEIKIRIFNPTEAKDGWESKHTVIMVTQNDTPFLVDSIRMIINKYGLDIHHIVHFGGLKLKRDASGKVTKILPPGLIEKNVTSEAPIYIEIDRLEDEEQIAEIEIAIRHALDDVRASVVDWRKMVTRIEDCLAELEHYPPNLDIAEIVESRDFLRWLINNNFTFLGARDYKLIGDGTNRALQAVPESGLGVLREKENRPSSKSYAELPPQARKMALSKDILIIAKTNTTSTVHRKAYTDYIGVKRFNDKGELIGERRFIGLYTSTAYNSSPRHIPFLRHKVDKVLHDLEFPPDSHDGKEAVHILETLPRDDLFQASHEELLHLTVNILQIKERKRIRLLVRRDAFYRYFSCLVYVPREIFNTNLASEIQETLMAGFNGLECSYTTHFSTSALARIHYIIRVNPKDAIEYSIPALEKKLIAIARSWVDELKQCLIDEYSEARGLKHYNKYRKAFSAGYIEFYSPKEAVRDIGILEGLSSTEELGISLHQIESTKMIGMKIFHAELALVLSDVLPILENMGLRVISERPYKVKLNDKCYWIHDFEMTSSLSEDIHVKKVKDIFKDAFTRIWFGKVENDGLNRLVLELNLTWKEISMLRSYTKYLRQIGFTLSQTYIEQTLLNNHDITCSLVHLFALRFDPELQRSKQTNPDDVVAFIEKSLDNVKSLDEDRIIRRFLELIQATTRTNYYQVVKDKPKEYISFKIDPALISDLPLPRPQYEIFVYSPRVEGVHLRAGKVARGGLRWSDRREDFRTEVLGLMKAQQVKNTVIVPEGAKGGFVVKMVQTPDMGRDEYLKEVIKCYSIFISGLLDITDNIKKGNVVPPKRVVRHDGDDPYLVVAADKGTATFSDIANSIAQKYKFWLDDAFASGGSAGYDHKKMGITSRGVWVSVQRHFREIGINPDQDDFTVIGIGDMAGDVFGNGLLMSKHIKLIGAFNHMHIFLDPNPDAAASYMERQRLFKLPRSSWADYDDKLISKGGGVFDRSAKFIRLTPELKTMFGTKKDTMVPNDLIKALFMINADLLWNGGIGTFVKSSNESNQDVGDRTNDAIRINGNELGVRVVAEGGNLGLTQLARIEYSLNGGIVNTDFIDNSAGVDCSDHEVNIKILLNGLVAEGKMTVADRNELLVAMTDEVAALVLDDNYEQTQMLSLETSVSPQTMDLFRHYINYLEKSDKINRSLEYLPDDKALTERKTTNNPLTRPEIAVLMAYSKMYLKKDILASSIPEDPYFNRYLLKAFPKPLREKYHKQMLQHSLQREIIATQLCKSISDRMGVNFSERIQRETGASVPIVIRAFSIAEHIFDMEQIWADITALDTKVNIEVQYRMMLQVYYLIRRATRWIIRNRKPTLGMEEIFNDFAMPVMEIRKNLFELFDKSEAETLKAGITYLVDQGVPEKLATVVASSSAMFTSLDIAEAAKKYSLDLLEVAKTYYRLGDRLELNWLRDQMNVFAVQNMWDELARAGFRDDLDRAQRKLSARILTMKAKGIKSKSINDRIDFWINKYQFLVDRWQKLLSEIKTSESVDFVTYSVVLRELFDFAQASS